MFFGTSIAVNILVLSKHKTDTKIQFIDASGEDFYKKETNNNILKPEHIEAIIQLFDSKKEKEYISVLNAKIKTTVSNIDKLRAEIDEIIAEIEGKYG